MLVYITASGKRVYNNRWKRFSFILFSSPIVNDIMLNENQTEKHDTKSVMNDGIRGGPIGLCGVVGVKGRTGRIGCRSDNESSSSSSSTSSNDDDSESSSSSSSGDDRDRPCNWIIPQPSIAIEKTTLPDEWIDEPKAKDGNSICSICYERAIATVIKPCRHATCCVTCARRLGGDKRCPVCRQPFERITRLKPIFIAGAQ